MSNICLVITAPPFLSKKKFPYTVNKAPTPPPGKDKTGSPPFVHPQAPPENLLQHNEQAQGVHQDPLSRIGDKKQGGSC